MSAQVVQMLVEHAFLGAEKEVAECHTRDANASLPLKKMTSSSTVALADRYFCLGWLFSMAAAFIAHWRSAVSFCRSCFMSWLSLLLI